MSIRLIKNLLYFVLVGSTCTTQAHWDTTLSSAIQSYHIHDEVLVSRAVETQGIFLVERDRRQQDRTIRTPRQREKLQKRREQFETMSPQQREKIRRAREYYRDLPPERRQELREQWRNMSPEERQLQKNKMREKRSLLHSRQHFRA